jgi:hypothetical protein
VGCVSAVEVHPVMTLPPDPFWLLRVQVRKHGGCVPFETWLIYHFQFQIAKGGKA